MTDELRNRRLERQVKRAEHRDELPELPVPDLSTYHVADDDDDEKEDD